MSSRRNALVDRLAGPLSGLSRHPDIAFAVCICAILAVLFVPLPPILLDLGLALSFAVSIMILMVALWIRKPLEFNSFPTLLLVVTIMRLALGVASTRLILAEGHTGTDAAGNVIAGIASFVVGGDYVIGAIIFAILIVINFIVITKGSTRIAEVSARFSLDAMPGKQMAIDADLSAGLIDESEKRKRQKEVEAEAGFFGAMDGAAKFVRGDAVAALIIIGVNIVGGILIAVAFRGMPFMDAVSTYTILTIGDGLVSQIPALIVSIAAGLVVAKGNMDGSASEIIGTQMTAGSKPLIMTAALVFFLGLLPGFPFLIFTLVALSVLTLAALSDHGRRKAEDEKRRQEQHRKASENHADASEAAKPRFDTIQLDLGSGLVMMVNEQDAALPEKVRNLRNVFLKEYGFLLPAVRISDVSSFAADRYAIRIQGVEVAGGEIQVGSRLVLDPGAELGAAAGKRVQEPAFGLPAIWVTSSKAADYERRGYTAVNDDDVVITHLIEVIKDNMPELMTYASVNELIEGLDKDYQKLLGDIPGASPKILLQHVLQNLLRERVSIRNLPRIVEAMADAGGSTKSLTLITEQVRRALSAQISKEAEVVRPGANAHNHDAKSRYIPVMTLAPKWEAEFARCVTISANGDFNCPMDPEKVQEFVLACKVAAGRFAAKDEWPAILVNANYRPIVRAMLERVAPMTAVLAYPEISRNSATRTMAVIGDAAA
ncbi:flagellar biosynthesis protein FlhA [Paracoccus sp. ME4]|uniref:flagellar biosynthesis protein FlhA n=1 Tax=Paracoccus sp. ME4 TaxID=3138066 RepID=UPI00398BA148